jgi:hypothetical protein
MSTAPKIGTIASPTEKLIVQRQGEQLMLSQGDAILAGDVLQNKDVISIDIELPGQAAGQADSLITLAPQSAAQVATSKMEAGTMIEVTSLTEGVELYALGEGADGAILVADAGTGFSGLVGGGLLASGSAAGGIGGVAAAVGGGVGVAAVAVSSGDDSNDASGAGFTDNRVDNGGDNGSPDNENPDNNENPDGENPDPEEPEEPDEPVDEGTTGTPLDAALDPLADALGSSPLSVVSEPLFDAIGGLSPMSSSAGIPAELQQIITPSNV